MMEEARGSQSIEPLSSAEKLRPPSWATEEPLGHMNASNHFVISSCSMNETTGEPITQELSLRLFGHLNGTSLPLIFISSLWEKKKQLVFHQLKHFIHDSLGGLLFKDYL